MNSRGMPQGMSGFDETSSKYHRVTLKRASLIIVGDSVRVHSSEPTMFRRSDVKSPTGLVVFPHGDVSLNSRSTGTKYVLKATRSAGVRERSTRVLNCC